MIYLNDRTIKELNISWNDNIQVISDAVQCLGRHETTQPVKPYLRYGDTQNRIIAMPAYVGGNINKAGIKWIASFPDNIHKGLPRAHSVTILNEAVTGVPVGVVNSGSLSAIRTASVSGFIIQQYMQQRNLSGIRLGMTGFGPIGQHHLAMCAAVLGNSLEEVFIYDLLPVREEMIPAGLGKKVTIAENWQQAYTHADIFITCTVSKERYINEAPKPGSLHLNVSLRDYQDGVFPWFAKGIIVDNWEEICRENTDIELFHKTKGLQKTDVIEIQDVLTDDFSALFSNDQPVMFNPMGMAVFDIAMADRFIKLARENNAGVLLDELDFANN